ncbi:MAG TPA: hypothetical protein V6D47_20785 [Oscillatoriaceae cyanobacterium]
MSLAGMLLAGCGAAPGSARLLSNGSAAQPLGSGTQPTLCARPDGSLVVAFVGADSGNRKIYWSESSDGKIWGNPRALDSHPFSDQSPRLVVDAQGVLNLYFASNRDGQNFEIYHSKLVSGAWQAPEEIPGFDGVESLAVVNANGKTLLAAQQLMVGLTSAVSTDGTHFGTPETVTGPGADPSLTMLPGGKALIAYTDDQTVDVRTCTPGGAWSDATDAADGADAVRETTLAFTGDRGELIYAERTPDGYVLRERHFDAELNFTDADLPVSPDARTPSLAVDHNGKISLAWGMKDNSGQTTIALTVLGDR